MKYTVKRFSAEGMTKYDETDALKRMKDSDILAEKKKKASINSKSVRNGAILGGLAGAALGKGLKGRGALGAAGALVGGLAGTINSYGKSKNEASFYNRRLDEAQRKARRREGMDWRNNMTNRDGYSY